MIIRPVSVYCPLVQLSAQYCGRDNSGGLPDTRQRLSRARYEGGYTSYLEVLDAERSLFNAELNYAQTQADLFNALVNVYKAMGGGWVDEAGKLAPRPAMTIDAPAR